MKFSNFDKFYITRIFKHFDCDVMIKPKDFISIYLKKIEDINFLKENGNLFGIEYNVIKRDEITKTEYIFEIYSKK